MAEKKPTPASEHPVAFRVLRAGNEDRIVKARIALAHTSHEDQSTETDENGNAEFAKVHEGTWQLTVAHDEYRTKTHAFEVQPKEEGTIDERALVRLQHATQDINEPEGQLWLGLLIFTLLATAWIYFQKHDDQVPPSLAVSMQAHVAAVHVAAAKEEGHAAIRDLLSKLQKSEDVEGGSPEMHALQARVRKRATKLNEHFAPAKEKPKQEGKAGKKGAGPPPAGAAPPQPAAGAAKSTVEGELDALFDLTRQIAIREAQGDCPDRSFFWQEPPGRYYEVLFWAFAGILVRLIWRTGTFLRWNRFYGRGRYQIITLLVATPLLTLVFVFLISLVRIDSEVLKVNFGDARILAGVAFLLAATPWKLWDRLMSLADTVRGDASRDKGDAQAQQTKPGSKPSPEGQPPAAPPPDPENPEKGPPPAPEGDAPSV